MKLTEIETALAEATQGKWEWKGRVAPDWLPDTWIAVDDLRVEIPTPDKDYDADLWQVLQATKSGFIMVRNADAKLIALAPDALRVLLAVARAAQDYRVNGGYEPMERMINALKALESEENE